MAVFIGVCVIAGFIVFIVSHEVKAKAQYRSTARNAALGMLCGIGMIGAGIYFALNLQMA